MPTLFERLSAAYKAIRFPQSGTQNVAMFSNMQTFQAAIARAIDLDNSNPAQSSLVFSAIRWLGNRLPEAEIEVRKPSQENDLEEETSAIPDHPMVDQWNWANRRQTGSVLMKAFAYSWILSGNVYFIKFRNALGLPVELWYEPHWSIKPRWVDDAQGAYIEFKNTSSNWITEGKNPDQTSDFITYYEIDRGNAKFRVETEDVVHFQDGIDPNYPRCGISGLTTLLREITGDSKIADYYSGILGSGGMPSYGVSIDKDLGLNLEEAQHISDGLKRLPVGQPAVVSGATFQQLGFSPKEMDNRVARYLSEERFCATVGIPAQCLNLGVGGERSIYNNVSEANRQGVEDVLKPLWQRAIADTLTRQLLPDFDQKEGHYVAFDLTTVEALKENEDDKAARVRADFEAGIITRGEARCARGYPEDDKVDNVYLVNGELVPADFVTPEPPDPSEQPAQFPAPVAANGQRGGLLAQAKSVHHLSSKVQQEKIREHWERHAPARVKGLISARGK